MLTFSHAKLARRDLLELNRYRNYLLTLPEGPPVPVLVLHDLDGACCRREAWATTDGAIVEALRPSADLTLLNLDLTGGKVLRRPDVH